MNIKKILCSVLAIAMILSTMGTVVFADEVKTYTVGVGQAYADLETAISAAKTDDATNVIFEIYGMQTISRDNYFEFAGANAETVSFVGKDDEAGIFLNNTNVNNPNDASNAGVRTGADLSFTNLAISHNKPFDFYKDDAAHRGGLFSFDGDITVTFTGCSFDRGIWLGVTKTVITDCTFVSSYDETAGKGEYMVWIAGKAVGDKVEISGSTFTGCRAVKLYNEAHAAYVDLTMTNNTVQVTEKATVETDCATKSLVMTNNTLVGCDAVKDTQNIFKNESYVATNNILTGSLTVGYVSQNDIWGELSTTATQSVEILIYAGDEKIAKTTLNNIGGIIDGSVFVTWHNNFIGNFDEYWTTEWYGISPAAEVVPDKVVLVADGVVIDENVIVFDRPDGGAPIVWTELDKISKVAKIGDTVYGSLQNALNAANAATNDVVVEIIDDIDLTGTTWTPIAKDNSGAVTLNGNNHTISGLSDMLFSGFWGGTAALYINDLTIADSNIVNDPDDIPETTAVGAFIGGPGAGDATLTNCHLLNSHVEGGHWTGGLVGTADGWNGPDGPVFMNLTFKDCSVTGSTITGKGSAGGIMGHASRNLWTNVVVDNCTVENNTITSTGSSTNKAGAVFGTVGAAGAPSTSNGVTLTGGHSVSAIVKNNNVTSNGTAITTIYGRQGTATGILELTGGEYENKPLADTDTWASVAEGYVLTQNQYGNYTLVEDNSAEDGEAVAVTENVEVVLVPVIGDATKYDIVLKADTDKAIHRFLSAEFDIQLTKTEENTLSIATVTGNSDLKIEAIDPKYTDYYLSADDKNVWGFHLDETANKITANEIKIGTVVLTGVGAGTLAIVENDNNKVEAIQSVSGSIVKKYVANGAGATLTLGADATQAVEVKKPTKNLTIQITFPNNIMDNSKAYQDMTVTIDGKDIETITKNLGQGGDATLSDNKYVIEIKDTLTKDHAYNIQVKGAGYRTANYRVTMTADKTVFFWNDASMTELSYEEGGTVMVKANFLAGDIAEDNIIDKYDLAAVVSYFGKYGLNTNPNLFAYNKYDLNRDGKIDSEDIAFVLASFGY